MVYLWTEHRVGIFSEEGLYRQAIQDYPWVETAYERTAPLIDQELDKLYYDFPPEFRRKKLGIVDERGMTVGDNLKDYVKAGICLQADSINIWRTRYGRKADDIDPLEFNYELWVSSRRVRLNNLLMTNFDGIIGQRRSINYQGIGNYFDDYQISERNYLKAVVDVGSLLGQAVVTIGPNYNVGEESLSYLISEFMVLNPRRNGQSLENGERKIGPMIAAIESKIAVTLQTRFNGSLPK